MTGDKKKVEKSDQTPPPHHHVHWDNEIEFLMTCVGK